jgi:hypothetical protein
MQDINTQPDTNNHLLEILTALAVAKAKFVVCGGVAVVLHGVERMTMDLDLSVDMTHDNMERFLAVIAKLNLKPRVPLPASVLLDSGKVKTIVKEKGALVFTFVDSDNPYRQVDVFLTEDHSYERLAHDAHAIELDGQRILVVSRRRLIEMKRRIDPPRLKDQFDLEQLEAGDV